MLEPFQNDRIEDSKFKTNSDRNQFVRDIFNYCMQRNIDVNSAIMREIADCIHHLLKNEKKVNIFHITYSTIQNIKSFLG